MNLKFFRLGEAHKAIEGLREKAAQLGKPQPAFTSLNIVKANREYERLTSLLSTTTVKSSSGPTADSIHITTPPPVEARDAAGPGTPSRFQLLSALELFPIAVGNLVGTESDDHLQALLKVASGEAGLRLPGDPDEPSPALLRQSRLNEILTAEQPPEPTNGAWNLESLAALTDSSFGPGTARSVGGVVSNTTASFGTCASTEIG